MAKLSFYKNQFSRGGFVSGFLSVGFAKGFVEGVLGRGFWRKHHSINNIRCESHIWAFLRAMELKYNINERYN